MSATTVSTSDISLQPLTTPFIPPPGCGNQYSTMDYLLYSKHSYHLSVSKELPSCQPSGWGEVHPFYLIRPGKPRHLATGVFPKCVRHHGVASRQTIPSPVPTVRMHEAWHITWASTDVPTLHPPPPDIGACTTLALSSWVPGAAVEGGLLCESSSGEPPGPTNTNNSENYHDRGSDTATRWFLIVGLPIIAVFAVVGCCICACCRQKKRRKKRLEPSNQQASLAS
ncbi:uncharacterized protein P174DRAFT_454692 [Aspergillus novofumigatus IBT 16806]|uniref:Uncharacterized protein n=1 Tax=Aspergillus novofumigatus (strain IBT 16806) TaxID=1392255 RepID=A0A2I1BWB6_ASPN1|nr:uncharacterized protein P174DRAFT_454692 [Aspergillus novofumigatus IBT 16806]PKX89675.1 hypothetical protein P174DRAFT_454692 [Aspergillus novofumigatus IBT 16806]